MQHTKQEHQKTTGRLKKELSKRKSVENQNGFFQVK